jgi:hypothetical protein
MVLIIPDLEQNLADDTARETVKGCLIDFAAIEGQTKNRPENAEAMLELVDQL